MSNDANYSDSIAYEIDQEMQNIVKTQYERCRQILTDHQEQLNLIAETLLEIETLDREQIEGLFHDGKLPERNYDNEPAEEDTVISDSLDEDKAGASYEEVKDKMDSEDTDGENSQKEHPEERPDMVEPPKPEGETEKPSVDDSNDERHNR